jgi:hypothetical protein
MGTRRVTPPWDYLQQASIASLESFELSRLNHAANLRKEIAALLEQWIEEAAEALLARWLRENHKSAQEASQPLDILPEICKPALTAPPAEPMAVRPHPPERRIRPPRRSAAAH